ncbi:hypothetical protein PIB30_050583 [Stylosanthes scabra]|uniref:Ubiquitin-like protease family profile domain-containing protein n=1 Tax=Stylosanthes scabra TaxID=79078 RepID=A0ABU6TJN6_9FABA|nr:hypothetical protein [Stylosanthes scabra]
MQWSIPICDRDHWYLYALNIAKKKLWVLDSLHSEPFDDIRRKVDEYAWFIPICDRDHWYLYALNIAKKKLWVLDSLHSEPFDDIRRKVDEYAGKIIHDMVKVAIPSFMHTSEGFEYEYADVPKQPNKDDCGTMERRMI